MVFNTNVLPVFMLQMTNISEHANELVILAEYPEYGCS